MAELNPVSSLNPTDPIGRLDPLDSSAAPLSSAQVSEGARTGEAGGAPAPAAAPAPNGRGASETATPAADAAAPNGTTRRPLLLRALGFLGGRKALLSLLLALFVETCWPATGRHPPVDREYLRLFLTLNLAVFLAWPLAVRRRPEAGEKRLARDDFHAAAFLLLTIYNMATSKLTVIPAIFFPTPDRVLAVLVEDFGYLVVTCLGSSARLLAAGFFSGALAGLITGIAIGFSKPAAYWLNPVIKILGPIPPTAWIPIVLVAFPTTWAGACFLIALSVWFPTSVMTSSGILNVQNAYFEVSSTLGARRVYQIFLVGIPAAMPLIFTGLFSGACASFLTLMTAEMVGVKNGIGWYINWQREMLSYANVYAGLIVIALTFYSLITLFFKVRDRVLVWQKGMIKW